MFALFISEIFWYRLMFGYVVSLIIGMYVFLKTMLLIKRRGTTKIIAKLKNMTLKVIAVSPWVRVLCILKH